MQNVESRHCDRRGVTTTEITPSGDAFFVWVKWDGPEGYEVECLVDDLRFLGPTDEVRAQEGESLEAIIARANGRG